MQVSSTIENPTLRHTFKESELPSLLESIRQEHPYCEVYLECPGPRKPRKRVLIFQNGDIGYCGDRKPTLEDYVGLIHHKINSDWIDRVFEDSQVNMQEEMSPLHFIQRLLQFRVLKKGDIIKLQISAFLLSLEPLYKSEGTLTINVQPEQDRYVPVEWRLVNLALEKRQKTWAKLVVHECTMNSVPIMTDQALELLRSDDTMAAEHEQLINFVEKIIDGRSNIIDLAQRFRMDPLSLGQKLTQASFQGWVNFLDEAREPSFTERSNILVVDENSTTRKLLVRLLQSCYDAHETAGTLEAVSMIPSKNIDAIIVSQSIPINSSFQLCRIIRQNPDFKHLPIIFIANKENFFEKAKAKMAGVTEYLTQPLDQTKILSILDLHT